jgi:hypothetical protein
MVLCAYFVGSLVQGGAVSGAHRDAASLGGKALRGCTTNALAGSSHNRDPSLKTQIHEVGIIKAGKVYRAWGPLAGFASERYS